MEVNKVECFGKVLLDLTEDSVTPDKMSAGVTAHDASGQKIVGTATLDGYTRTILYEGLMYSLGTYTIGSIIGYDEIEILYANQINSASNTEQFSTLRMMAKDMLNLTSPVSEDVILLAGSYVSSGMRRLMFRMIDDKTLKITTNNNIAITKITGIKYDYGGVPTQWFTGTEVTGTGGQISAVVLGSKAGDMYLNTDTSYVYKASAENEWYYVCDIKGDKGDTGNSHLASYSATTSIAASAVDTKLPTEKAVKTFVEGKGYTTNTGTITGIKMNGASKGTSGVVDLGTVLTSHQDISSKLDKSGGVVTGNLNGPTPDGETNPKWVISKEGNAFFPILSYFSVYVVNLINGYSKLKNLVVETINNMKVPEYLDFVDDNFAKRIDSSRVIGTWIDESYLYENVVTFISPGPNDYDAVQPLNIGDTTINAYERHVDLSHMNIKQLISVEGILNDGNVNVPITTLYQNNQNINWWFSANTGRLIFRSLGYEGYKVNLIIKYLNKE